MSGRIYPFNKINFYGATGALVVFATFAGANPALAADACAPTLSISDVHFSEMQPPTLARTWSAVVSVDASHCPALAAHTSDMTGTFDIVFLREKETAPDLEFRQRFMWRTPSVKVQIDFAADEAVGGYRIDNVMPCVCGG